MNELTENINNYMFELEDLSSKMAEKAQVGNFLAITRMDLERKNIIRKISKDAANIQTSHKKRLKLVWSNNEKLVKNISDELNKKKKHHSKIKKTLIAYGANN